MRTLPISEINEMSNGEIVPRFEGKVVQVFEQKTGTNDYGEWFLQNLIVRDATGELIATWAGADPLDALQGQTVAFESSESKHGLQGIKREIKKDKVKDKTYEGVRLTNSCKIKRQQQQDKQDTDTAELTQNFKAQPATEKPPPSSTAERIDQYAEHSLRVLMVGWDKSQRLMETIAIKDAQEMSAYEWLDLKMRAAQHIGIDVGKIIRKERF